ncbi:hypothetical protein [Cyclobacterium roseum]|uniref:hypothetical protein n=2 Tax=Cyclobacterium TaxID=68288 RepID=UPI001F457FD2|nr:hypothetical protein [Cyclobacterium roseum]
MSKTENHLEGSDSPVLQNRHAIGRESKPPLNQFTMRLFTGLVLWAILFVLCWPIALLLLLLYPLIWLILLPFRLLGLGVTLTLSMIFALFMLPFSLMR